MTCEFLSSLNCLKFDLIKKQKIVIDYSYNINI